MPTEKWFREHDSWPNRGGTYRIAFRAYVPFVPDSVLDIGCALGDGLIVARKEWPAAKVNGADISRVALRKCYQRLPDGVFVRWDMATEPIPEIAPKSDLVLCVHTLEHIGGWREIQAAVRGMLQVTKRQLLILVPNQYSIPSTDHKYIFSARSFDVLEPTKVMVVEKGRRVVAMWGET